MAQITADFVKETTTTTGTGAITLAGARAPARTFSSVCANGDTFHYAISHTTTNEWEVGLGTYNSGPNTITRTTVLASSNAGAAVNFSAGTKNVDIVLPAARIVQYPGPVSAGTQTAGSGSLVFANSNGVTFGLSNNTITASAAGGGGAITASLFSYGTAQISSWSSLTQSSSLSAGVVHFPQLNTLDSSRYSQANVSFRIDGQSLLAGAAIDFGDADALASVKAQALFIQDAGGVSLGLQSSSNATHGRVAILTASSVPFAIRLHTSIGETTNPAIVSGFHSTVSTAAFNMRQLPTGSTSAFSFNNILWCMDAGTLMGAAYQRFYANAAAFRAQQMSMSDLNDVSFGLFINNFASFGDVAVYTASFLPKFGLASHVGGNSVANVTRLAFQNSNGISFGLSTAASAATVTASVAAGGVPGSVSAGTTSMALGQVVFSNSNNVSFGLNGSTVTATATFAGGGIAASAAGASASAGTVVWSNSNNVSFGMNGSTITATATVAATRELGVVSHVGGNVVSSVSRLAFENSNGVTFSLSTATNAATVRASVDAGGGADFTYSGFMPAWGNAVIVTQSLSNNSFWVQPLNNAPTFQFDRIVQLFGLSNQTNATNSNTLHMAVGVYSRNVSTLSLVASTSFSVGFTGSGTGGNYSLFSGPRHLTFGWTTTFSRSNLWLGVCASQATAGNASFSVSFGMLSQSITNQVHGFGLASNATYQSALGKGFYTATTTAAPNSIAFSQINGTFSAAYRFPAFLFQSGTA